MGCSEELVEAAQNPKRATVDGVSAEQHSLSEQIALDRYCKTQQAQNTVGGPGFRVWQIIPPGSV